MLLKRKNTYYFRWQIPKGLRLHLGYELIQSLRTSKKIQALIQITNYIELVQLIKDIGSLMLLKKLTQESYWNVIESIKVRILPLM